MPINVQGKKRVSNAHVLCWRAYWALHVSRLTPLQYDPVQRHLHINKLIMYPLNVEEIYSTSVLLLSTLLITDEDIDTQASVELSKVRVESKHWHFPSMHASPPPLWHWCGSHSSS